MKAFLKENPALALGLGLPLAIVLVFSLAASLPGLYAPPPRYDVVFATGYYDYNNSNGYHISVVGGKFHLTYNQNCGYSQVPQLYRYHAANGSVSRIDFTPPETAGKECPNASPRPPVNSAATVSVSVPELADITLNTGNPAPDGYQFSTRYDNYSGTGILPSLFFTRSYDRTPELRKGTNHIRIPMGGENYTAYNAYFIGWIETH